MADTTVQKLDIELNGKVKIDKGSAKKAGQEAGKLIQGGMEEVMHQSSSQSSGNSWKEFASFWNGTGDTMKLLWKELKTTSSAFRSAFSKITAPVKKAKKHIDGFFGAIKRIAIYRAIRWALKEIIQGFQEGIQNAYQWAVVTGNQFAHSMDMMATSALYLKNSLGAMTMPLVNVLAPILDRIIDQFVDLINVVNQFIATITGASTWVKALKYPAEYLEQAAGSAKELKNQLLGFDELNILNAPRAGGGGSALDYSNMFKQMSLNPKSLDFAKALKEAIKKGDWKGVGSLFAKKFNEMIDGLDVMTLANTLGDKVNDIVAMVHTFLQESNFHQVGVKIGQFMSNLKLDWYTIAKSWVRWHTNIYDTIIGVFQGVDWKRVGKSLGEYIKGLFDGFNDWLKSVDWRKLASDATRAFFDLIAGIDWNGILRAFYNALWGVLNSVWQGLSSAWRTIIGIFTGDVTGSQLFHSVNDLTPSGGAGESILDRFTYASGGFPTQGSMFIAGESGAEWVGNIGGRTGVYNTDQMAMALASANDGVVATLTAVGNAIVGAINRKDLTINTNDVRKALNGMQMRYGV